MTHPTRPLVLAFGLLLAACEPAQPAPPQAPPQGPPLGPAATAVAVPSAQPPVAPPMPVAPGARLPYAQIEAIVRAAAPGEIVEVELEQVDPDDGYGAITGLYEIKVLTASGRVLELEIDAGSGQILKQEIE